MFGRATIRLGIGPRSSFYLIYVTISSCGFFITCVVVCCDTQGKVDDHRRKWDRSEFEKLARERLAAEEREVKSSSSRDVGRREPPVKRDLLKPRDYKVCFFLRHFLHEWKTQLLFNRCVSPINVQYTSM